MFKSRVFWFFLGFLIGPVAVVGGFGEYTKYSVSQLDKQNAILFAMNQSPALQIKQAHDKHEEFIKLMSGEKSP